MAELIVMVGLPASGKSTMAIDLVRSAVHPTKRVNRDSLRSMLDCGLPWNREQEYWVETIETEMMQKFLRIDFDVVCDDTNIKDSVRARWREVARACGAAYREIHLLDVPLDKLLDRDAARDKTVGEDVILRMYQDYLESNLPKP